MASIQAFLLLAIPLIPIIVLAIRSLRGARSEGGCYWLLAATVLQFVSLVTLAVCQTLTVTQAEPSAYSHFSASIPLFPGTTVFKIALRLDLLNGAGLVGLQLALLTIAGTRLPHRSKNENSLIAFLAFGSWLLLGDDLVSLATASSLAVLGLAGISRSSKSSPNENSGTGLPVFLFVGWMVFLCGIAWLAAVAAIVRSAPHGVPGETTFVVTDLAHLLQVSIRQHPAARFLWEQYRLLPVGALAVGVGLLAGLFPFQELYSRRFAKAAFEQRVGLLFLSNAAFIHFARILSDFPASTAEIPDVPLALPELYIPAMLGFAALSFFLNARLEPDELRGRVVTWAHQFVFLGFVLLHSLRVVCVLYAVVTQFASLVLICLEDDQQGAGRTDPSAVGKWIAVATVGVLPGTMGMLLVWQVHQLLNGSEEFGAASGWVFAGAILVSVVGLVKLLPDEGESHLSQSPPLVNCFRWIWIGVAIVSSIAIPVWALIQSRVV
ncbi:hypothetical protein AB1L42_07475 [Thalassoglobus sp. JC818]|uniref:hypothetical protein n=1 Tax=Thalassoglobus sp. JC818 TaxID=3232136 RepID=UPI00345A036C